MMQTLFGVLVVSLAGLIMGSGAWPFKLMRRFQFEHWWFISMLVGLIIMPWTIMLLGCPNAIEGLRAVPASALIKANLFACGWGIANVLCGLCFVRIGIALTGAILTGLGVSVGAVMPMIFKGSGLFKGAADLSSPAGLAVLCGVVVMLIGVLLAALAGFGRDHQLQKLKATSGGFLGGLIMIMSAGVLSTGTAFAFIYSQDPIVVNVSMVQPSSTIGVSIEGNTTVSGRHEVAADGTVNLPQLGRVKIGGLNVRRACEHIRETLGTPGESQITIDTGSIAVTFAVFAVSLLGGALINIGYAVYMLTKNKSWPVFATSGRDISLAVIMGLNFGLATTLMGKGMLLLGALGASVGWGIQQAMQMTGGQAVGFISGEWRGVTGKPRRQMYAAIAVLIVAAMIMAYGNTLTKA